MIGIMAKQERFSIGIDLGGTKILAGVIDAHGKVVGKGKKATGAKKGVDSVLERIHIAMDEALAVSGLGKKHISAIGIGVPGIFDASTGVVKEITNIPGFRNIDLAKSLRQFVDVPVVMSNDVRVAAVGEHRIGAGRGIQNLIAVFVGTGIGGGIILNGQVYAGSRGSAGEIGHMVVMAHGPFAVGGGVRGGIEALASRSAIERELRAALAQGRESALPALMAEKDGELKSSVLARAVEMNDALTIEVLRRAAYYLGLHGASLVNAFDPQMLIYGGGVFEGLGDWMLSQVRATVLQFAIAKHRLEEVQVVQAHLGEEAGIVGAGLLALD